MIEGELEVFITCLLQLLKAHNVLKEEIDTTRQTAVCSVEKEHKSAHMMASLTAVCTGIDIPDNTPDMHYLYM